MSDTQATIPDEIDFNSSEIQEASKRKNFTPTGRTKRVRFVVTNAEKKVSEEKGTLLIAMTCAPLKDPENADSKGSPTIRHSLIIPKANKEFPGHKAPNTIGLCHAYFRATCPDAIPDYPRFDREQNSYTYEGEPVERDEYPVHKLEVDKAVAKKLAELWSNPASLIDDAFYAEVIDNNGFSNLRNLAPELPDDCELVDPANWTGSAEEEEAPAEEPAPKAKNGKTNGHTKAAVKKAPKKKK